MSEGESIRPKSIKVNYMVNLIYELFTLLVPLITTPYVSRVLGASGIGEYSYTNSIAQYFILFGNLGVATYGQMKIAACRSEKKEVSKVFYELWILRSASMLLSFGVYIIVSLRATEYVKSRLILSILFIASIFDITWLFRGIEDFTKIVIRNFAVKSLMIVLIFTFVKDSNDSYIYVFLIAMSTLLGNLTFIFSIKGILCKVKYNELNVMKHFRMCFIYFIPTIATSVYTLLDKTMIGFFSDGTEQNGYYEQAHRIEQILITFITSLNMIMRSRMSFLFQQGKLDEMRVRLEKSLSFVTFLATPMTAGLIVIAPYFIPVFLGSGFDESILLLQIFALLIVIIGLSNCLNTHFLGPSGRQGKNNYVLVLGASVNFCLNYLWIPKFGAIGAAISSVIAETIILMGYLFLIRDFLRMGILLRLSWKHFVSGIIMIIALSQIPLLNISNELTVFIQVILGVLIYCGMDLILRDKYGFCYLTELVTRYIMRLKSKD